MKLKKAVVYYLNMRKARSADVKLSSGNDCDTVALDMLAYKVGGDQGNVKKEQLAHAITDAVRQGVYYQAATIYFDNSADDVKNKSLAEVVWRLMNNEPLMVNEGELPWYQAKDGTFGGIEYKITSSNVVKAAGGGRSMSVNDVVFIDGECMFCDIAGFESIPELDGKHREWGDMENDSEFSS